MIEDGLDAAGWPDRMRMLDELCAALGVNTIGKPPRDLWDECIRYIRATRQPSQPDLIKANDLRTYCHPCYAADGFHCNGSIRGCECECPAPTPAAPKPLTTNRYFRRWGLQP